MKAGDRFIQVYDRLKDDYIEFQVHTVDKLSKDGKKIRTLSNDIVEVDDDKIITSGHDFQRTVRELMEKTDFHKSFKTYSHFVVRFTVYPTNCSFGSIEPVIPVDDEFDDTVHLFYSGGKFTVEAKLAENTGFSKLEERKIEANHIVSYWFITGFDSLIAFFADKANWTNEPSLLEKLNEWLGKNGYEKREEPLKDYLGGTTQVEWAIDNNIDYLDYDRWQLVQKLLKHELKYETARDIFNTLYEKEEIEIFDCDR